MRSELSILNEKLQNAIDNYKYYQRCIIDAKHDYLIYDPYDGLSKWEHERNCVAIISDCRFMINELHKDIKRIKKEIKIKNTELNYKRLA